MLTEPEAVKFGNSSTERRVQFGLRWLPYGVFLVLAAALWMPYTTYLNSDGICYLSVAHEYQLGHWSNAVNTYWSPLFSWLIAVGLALHLPGLTAARIVLDLAGLSALAALDAFLGDFISRAELRTGALVSAAPMLAYFSVRDVTPEVLVVFLLLVYLRLVGKGSWFWAGVLGGLLYLTKAYSFAFVLVHLTLMLALRRQLWRGYLAAMAALLAISLPWMYLISKKAGHPVLSTAGAYNFELARVGKSGHPMLTQGLFPPPNGDAASVWEEPATMPMRRWSPFESAEAFSHELRVVLSNVTEFAKYALWTSVFTPLIVVGFAWSIWRRWRAGEASGQPFGLLITYALYPLGYLPLMFEHRYVWIDDVLTIVMAACLASYFWDRHWVRMAALVVGLSFWCAPLYIAVRHRHDYRREYELTQLLRPLHLAGHAASNAKWDDSAYLAYELGLPYYGIPRAQAKQPETAKALRGERIKYVFLWQDEGPQMPMDSAREILAEKDLKVYALPD